MADKIRSDNEVINDVLQTIYNNGNYIYTYIERVLDHLKIEYDTQKCRSLLNKMRLDGLIEILMAKDQDAVSLHYYKDCQICLTEKSKNIIYKHGSYIEYLRKKKAKHKYEKLHKKLTRIIKYASVVLVIFTSISTCILSKLSITEDTERKKLQQEIKQLDGERDSLKQQLRIQQMHK